MIDKVGNSVCAAVLLFSLCIYSQDFCITPKNEYGTCMPILYCDPLVPLVTNTTMSAETAKYLDSLQCGSLRLESFVCCVLPENGLESSTILPETPNEIEYGASCKTANNTSGFCVFLHKCQIYVDILKNKLSVNDFNNIINSKCEYEGDILKVCCPTHTTTEMTTPFPDAVELLEWCTTPDGNEGLCTVLTTCQHSMEILTQNPLSQEKLLYLRKSQCGMQGTIPKVCCSLATSNSTTQKPLITSTIPSMNELDPCFTPFNEQGLCISIKKCSAYIDILKNEHITQEDMTFLRNAQCGYEKNNPKVCCPNESLKMISRFSNIALSKGKSMQKYSLLPEIKDCGKQIIYPYKRNSIFSQDQEFPWIALLKYDDRKYHCGGVLINKRYVLTAAHCITGINGQKYFRNVSRIQLGVHAIKSEQKCISLKNRKNKCKNMQQDVSIDEINIHPNWSKYDYPLHNDIALIRLSQEVNYTEFVQPICLTNESNIVTEGSNVFTAGWGIKQNINISSRYKLKTKMSVMNKNKCPSAVSGQFCAGNDGKKNICSGDSGGPVMFQKVSDNSWYCVGIVTIKNDSCNFPDVFIDIPYYFEWIVANLKP